jgi:hypothetical protein
MSVWLCCMLLLLVPDAGGMVNRMVWFAHGSRDMIDKREKMRQKETKVDNFIFYMSSRLVDFSRESASM